MTRIVELSVKEYMANNRYVWLIKIIEGDGKQFETTYRIDEERIDLDFPLDYYNVLSIHKHYIGNRILAYGEFLQLIEFNSIRIDRILKK